MKVAVIGDEHTVAGFALIGLKVTRIATGKEDAERALTELLDDPEMGILIIEDRLAEMISQAIAAFRETMPMFPIIIEIPGRGRPIKRDDPMQKIFRRTVGISIETKEEETT